MKRTTIKSSIICLIICVLAGGCLSIPNRETVPARNFPSIQNSKPKTSMEMLNLLRLRMDVPDVQLLGPGDILGIYIAGVTGSTEADIPLHNIEKGSTEKPASGYPYYVRTDGTLSLPMLPEPIYVEGMSLIEAEDAIRTAYTMKRKILLSESNISVTMIRPRTYHVSVVREDSGGNTNRIGNSNNDGRGVSYFAGVQRGSAYSLELPAYKNDILEALSLSGGLPGLDAKNEIVILRKAFDKRDSNSNYMSDDYLSNASNTFTKKYNETGEFDSLNSGMGITRIPLRAEPGTQLAPLSSEDVTLHDGDVIFIRNRDAEVFYTGGVLKGGVFPIPRDYDLDVMGAISTAGGSVGGVAASGTNNSGFGGSNGIPLMPPTRILVLREVNGRQYAIKISQKDLIRYPSERILIKPNDVIVLEFTTTEFLVNTIVGSIGFRFNINDLWN